MFIVWIANKMLVFVVNDIDMSIHINIVTAETGKCEVGYVGK